MIDSSVECDSCFIDFIDADAAIFKSSLILAEIIDISSELDQELHNLDSHIDKKYLMNTVYCC